MSTLFDDLKQGLEEAIAYEQASSNLQPLREIMKILQNYRLSNNLTQEQFAEKSGISLSDIKMLESADGDPSLNLLKRLADSMEMELRISFVPADKALKQEVSDIYEQLGMDLPTAFRMFMKRSQQVRGLPFEATLLTQTITIGDALDAFYSARQQMADEPEMSIEEINAEISAARADRKR